MRYKEFNPNVILEKCITLFWNKGFGACAISDIVEKTGVNRFSLYETFENKEGILIAAMKLYYERYSCERIKNLTTDKPLNTSLRKFYDSFLHEDNARPAGCFIVHTATELADANPRVKEILDLWIGDIEREMLKILNHDNRTAAEAEFLMHQFVGLFCTSISFCLIHVYQERLRLIDNGIQVILDKRQAHAART